MFNFFSGAVTAGWALAQKWVIDDVLLDKRGVGSVMYYFTFKIPPVSTHTPGLSGNMMYRRETLTP
ncbi:hypothetical protein ACR6HW_06205 [Fusibacter sp. JL298sf-3]